MAHSPDACRNYRGSVLITNTKLGPSNRKHMYLGCDSSSFNNSITQCLVLPHLGQLAQQRTAVNLVHVYLVLGHIKYFFTTFYWFCWSSIPKSAASLHLFKEINEYSNIFTFLRIFIWTYTCIWGLIFASNILTNVDWNKKQQQKTTNNTMYNACTNWLLKHHRYIDTQEYVNFQPNVCIYLTTL